MFLNHAGTFAHGVRSYGRSDIPFYCGTGWRGSEAFYNAWLMGFPRISVYDGGWYEWSNDPGNPTETGIPEHLLAAGHLE
jgi:thiosulfate/3-mercaptopyruvate sulfurtransferase